MKIKLGNYVGQYVADQAGAKYVLSAGAIMANSNGPAIDAAADAAGRSFVINGMVSGATTGITIGNSQQLAIAQNLVVGKAGTIDANGVAVDIFGDGSHLVNRGLIRSVNDGASGISTKGQDVDIINAGTIIGETGIIAVDDDATITNTGTISAYVSGVDFDTEAADSGRLVNSGTIAGKISSVTGSPGAETIVNSGLLLGSVSLAYGDDVFQNRGGNVVGTIYGGFGDDTFYVDKASLKITEGAGQGYDTVRSSVSWVLADHFESGILMGKQNINLTGNDGDSTLSGNRGDNVINGRAGGDWLSGNAGFDLLTGGTEGDIFIFQIGCDLDVITDFEDGADKLDLSQYAGIDGLADLSIKMIGGDTLITFGKGDGVTLLGVDPSQLTESDFVF